MIKTVALALLVAGSALSARTIHDNRVHFSFHTEEDTHLESVEAVDLRNLGNVPDNSCIDKGFYSGIASKDEAVNKDEHSSGDFVDDDKYSCIEEDIYINSDHKHHEFYVRSGRHNSATAANFFKELIGGDSSLILLSNSEAFKKEDGELDNGFPEGLNFVFVIDATFVIDHNNGSSESLTCGNMVFAQQGVDGYKQHWATKLAKQAAGIAVDTIEIVASDGTDFEADAEEGDSLVKDITGDIKDLVKQLANMKNVWWVGQVYADASDNFNFIDNSDRAPAQNLPEGQYQHAFKCSNDYLMFLTEDTDSDYTYKVEFLKYSLRP